MEEQAFPYTSLWEVSARPEMRKAFAGLEMQSVGIRYNLQTTDKAKPKRELIIRNFFSGYQYLTGHKPVR
ncbi:hypothetical protein [Salmonella enterica]|uniref:hypothetical protein n=1 Tax=Salmonella enterica TaxID=28901 RepID=UPI003D18617E|nr:hypothetical protein [Salmonella enterica subsp. enterica serovar Minnesota]